MSKDYQGFTPLRCALLGRSWTIELFPRLFNHMKPELFRMGLDQHSKSVLYFMGENALMPVHLFKEAMDRGTPVKASMKSGGRNFLIHMLAIQEKDHDQNRIIQIAKEAMRKGLDLSSVDVHRGSFLLWAAYHNLTTVFR